MSGGKSGSDRSGIASAAGFRGAREIFREIAERGLTGFSKTGRDAACLVDDESGEVAEWLKAPLSKSGILATTGIVGSNPTLSAIFFAGGDVSAGGVGRRAECSGEMTELAEGARLEIVCAVYSGTEGSNPSLSAIRMR